MSDPVPSRPPARANPTRQQLDELDALLERMLALPVNQLEEALDLTRHVPSTVVTLQAPEPLADGAVARLFDAPYSEFVATPEPPATVHGAVAEAPTPVDPVVEATPPEVVAEAEQPPDPETAPWLEPAVAAAPPAETATEEPAAAVVPAPAPAEECPPPEILFINPARPGSLARHPMATQTGIGKAIPRRRSAVAGLVLPLVWANRAFDLSVGRLGPLGRFLQRPAGRSLVGWTGLALLGAAAAWGLLDWIGRMR